MKPPPLGSVVHTCRLGYASTEHGTQSDGGEQGGHRTWHEQVRDEDRLRPPSGRPPELPEGGVTVALRLPGGGIPDAAAVLVDVPDASPVDAEMVRRIADARGRLAD